MLTLFVLFLVLGALARGLRGRRFWGYRRPMWGWGAPMWGAGWGWGRPMPPRPPMGGMGHGPMGGPRHAGCGPRMF